MSLREILKNYNLKTGVSELKEFPKFSSILRDEKKRLIKIFGFPIDEPIIDRGNLEKIIPEIISHYANQGSIKNLSPLLKIKIPFCIWFEKNPLKTYQYIINDYYDDVIQNPTKKILFNLFYAYLINYDVKDIDCKKIGNVIIKE